MIKKKIGGETLAIQRMRLLVAVASSGGAFSKSGFKKNICFKKMHKFCFIFLLVQG
jgi:hypothetical protein